MTFYLLNFERMAEKSVDYRYDSRSVAVGDFNTNTVLYLVIAQQAVEKIIIYFGDGSARFQSSIEYSTGLYSSSRMVQVDDRNNDSQLDIAVANVGITALVFFTALAIVMRH